jgi:hypothetical protein
MQRDAARGFLIRRTAESASAGGEGASITAKDNSRVDGAGQAPRRLAQVFLLRILTVCGEVAERLKAAVC